MVVVRRLLGFWVEGKTFVFSRNKREAIETETDRNY
jgi:hypothetical protein